jgi:hypothetical protein
MKLGYMFTITKNIYFKGQYLGMGRVKDMRIVPVLVIPFILYLLLFSEDEGRTILSFSVFAIGIIVFRFFRLETIGFALIILGTILIFCLSGNYEHGRFAPLRKRISPTCIEYYDRLFSPFRQFETLHKIAYRLLAIFWVATLIIIIYEISSSVVVFVILLLVPIIIFTVIYYLFKREKEKYKM